jgi:hypothetical protein
MRQDQLVGEWEERKIGFKNREMNDELHFIGVPNQFQRVVEKLSVGRESDCRADLSEISSTALPERVRW